MTDMTEAKHTPALIERAREAIRGMLRLADMGFEESLREPEENGNFAAYNRAKAVLAELDAALSPPLVELARNQAFDEAALVAANWNPGRCDRVTEDGIAEAIRGLKSAPPPLAGDERLAEWRAFEKMMSALNGIEDGLSADQMRRRLYGEIHALRPSTPRTLPTPPETPDD